MKGILNQTGSNIFEVLNRDHTRIWDIFKEMGTKKDSSWREDLFCELQGELIVHISLEEDLFYSLLKETGRSIGIVLELFKEHRLIEELLQEFVDISGDEEIWEIKIRELQEAFEKHIRREEQQLFPQARNLLGESRPLDLGRSFLQEKQLQMGTLSCH